MDNGNYNSRIVAELVQRAILRDEPFTLIDVGCSGGIDPLWRQFGGDLVAHGFDPQQTECRRLQAQETNPWNRYHACYVGLPPDHPFKRAEQAERGAVEASYWHPIWRSSAAATWGAPQPTSKISQSCVHRQSNVLFEDLTTERIGIAEFAARERLSDIDFIKIDTDGADLEALTSAVDVFRPCCVLGVMIETPFTGSHHATANSFHNIDRLMKNHGFMLYQMSVNRYSRSVLPARFVYTIAAQTVSGQPIWGDLVYLRDGASADYARIWGEKLSPAKLLKLAALYDLFSLPDCAAELLMSCRRQIRTLVPVDALLDSLTPALNGRQVSHAEYLKAFADDPTSFFANGPFDHLVNPDALHINRAEQEHLASLGLSLDSKRVLEVGAGIGLHTPFFLARGCTLTVTDGNLDNVAEARRRLPSVDVRFLDLEQTDDLAEFGCFDLVYCYGLLHYLRNPDEALRKLASVCDGQILLETCVALGEQSELHLIRDVSSNNQAVSRFGCRPTRRWVMDALRRHFGHAYLTCTQPDHPDFQTDWGLVKTRLVYRAVFVGSKTALSLTSLTQDVPRIQPRLA